MADQHSTTNNSQSALPEQVQEKPRSFQEDLKTVRNVGGWVVLLVASNSLPTFIAKSQSSSTILGVNGVAQIFQFYLSTFPLTATATIIGLGIVRGWYKGCLANPYIGFLICSLIITLTTAVALKLGSFPTGFDPFIYMSHINSSFVGLALLYLYFLIYGPWTFFVSLVVGGFIAWAGGKMMWPYAQKYLS